MSNIYIQEPPTLGKVLLITSVGEIDVELWSKEAPKACRNFVQLCMEGYYNGTIFHRVVRDFIAQGGDPSGTGQGGESIYGEPFKDEIHSRLRFNRRGLVAMANSGPNDNGSQFFFTLNATPELQGKHTIFGKVVGDTIYNMIKLDAETDEDERPLHTHKIIKTEILNNPFPDIVPRIVEKKEKKQKKAKEKGVKNFKLLSFGEEAEEDEEKSTEISRSSKIKSSHDVLDDPKLSKAPAVESAAPRKESESEEEEDLEEDQQSGKDEQEDYDFHRARKDELMKRKADIQKEIDQLKKDYRNSKKQPKSDSPTPEEDKEESNNEIVEEYKNNLVKYGKLKADRLKGTAREDFTMKMLSSFKNKLKEVKEKQEDEEEASKPEEGEEVPEDYDGNDGSW